jgi:hypothetical protein
MISEEDLERIQNYADEHKIPGPSVEEHPEGYKGECYCQRCLDH